MAKYCSKCGTMAASETQVFCGSCGAQLDASAAAPVSAHQKSKPKSRLKRYLLLGSVGIIFVAALSSMNSQIENPAPSTRPKPTPGLTKGDREKSDNFVQDALKNGIITKIDYQTQTVQMNPLTWRAADYDFKKLMTEYIAVHMENKTTYRIANLIDSKTGKKLASKSYIVGTKVEQ